jgi:hypothetical protein
MLDHTTFTYVRPAAGQRCVYHVGFLFDDRQRRSRSGGQEANDD